MHKEKKKKLIKKFFFFDKSWGEKCQCTFDFFTNIIFVI